MNRRDLLRMSALTLAAGGFRPSFAAAADPPSADEMIRKYLAAETKRISAKFLDGADLWIIAAARTLGATVVTQEQAAGAGTRKIKIPNVCAQFDVNCLNTFQMPDTLDARF